ncbi:MAG: PHP domain-containing protein [Deltaproteobacteria bacterium]|jgi:predicted metal-dependent phosphoesterase TrpH|nr:PHP domain-containing protein [Deltaproteobacteria bacterium]
MLKIDFHSHSTFSDGTLEPYQLVAAASSAGLAGLALTDHDTTEGTGLFLEAAGRRKGFTGIAGTELSLDFKNTTHLLGLNVSPGGSKPLDLSFLQRFREERNEGIFNALEALGKPVSRERVAALSGSGQTGKPHFAKAMLERGWVAARQEAFDLYLGLGKPAYVKKRRLTPPEAVKLLLKAGWCPVLAHPISMGVPEGDLAKVLGQWKAWGLVGLEVWHPSHSPEASAFFGRLARDAGLVATCGSDYHGANKDVPINWTLSRSPLSAAVLDRLREGLAAALAKGAGGGAGESVREAG